MKLDLNVPVRFYKKTSVYEAGKGANTSYQLLQSQFAEKLVNVFWVEWRGTFGTQVLEAYANGVSELATLRMAYNPVIYDALRGSEVVIVKNADDTVVKKGQPDLANPNAYILFGGVDNYKEKNEMLEFKVRRYEQK